MKSLKIVAVIVALGAALYVSDDYWPQYFANAMPTADEVVVSKSNHELVLMKSGSPIKSYGVSFGGQPTGHKTEEGDERTPEGTYAIDWRNENSRFYRSLHVSYPNVNDIAQAAARNVLPGGDIMIHGSPNGLGLFSWVISSYDWTDGCIAVNNVEMAEIWASVENGTPITIVP